MVVHLFHGCPNSRFTPSDPLHPEVEILERFKLSMAERGEMVRKDPVRKAVGGGLESGVFDFATLRIGWVK